MATSNVEADQAWGMLADLEEDERRAKILQRYTELAALPEEERAREMLKLTTAEYALPDDKLRTFTLSRLSVWLALDSEVAHSVAASYDAAMLKMPGPQAMRRVGLVQTLAKEFPLEDRERLIQLVPNVFAGAKEVISAHRLSQPPAASPIPAKRGWWPFGRR